MIICVIGDLATTTTIPTLLLPFLSSARSSHSYCGNYYFCMVVSGRYNFTRWIKDNGWCNLNATWIFDPRKVCDREQLLLPFLEEPDIPGAYHCRARVWGVTLPRASGTNSSYGDMDLTVHPIKHLCNLASQY